MYEQLVNRYATLARDVEMKRRRIKDAQLVEKPVRVKAGVTVKIVSTFCREDLRDYGITDKLEGEITHGCRVELAALACLRVTPDAAPIKDKCSACSDVDFVRLLCAKCKKPVCATCAFEDEVWSCLCYWCMPSGSLKKK